jgi:hypothetical protein
LSLERREAPGVGNLMKRFRNLFPGLYAFENLYAAWRNARRGKRYTAAADLAPDSENDSAVL